MSKHKIIVLGFFFVSFYLAAQPIDTTTTIKRKFLNRALFIPAGLITTGAIFKIKSIQKDIQQESKNTFGKDFHVRIDDYLQFVPIIQLFTGKSLGFSPVHGYKQMIVNEIFANTILTGVVHLGKNGFKDLRPDGSAYNSFPSGHTTSAFANATLLFLEYRDSNIWYASSGYLFATATGVLRLANNRHWSGDVSTGAGLGILIASAVFYWNPFNLDSKTKHSTSAWIGYPIINDKTYGMGMVYKFK